MLTETLFAPVWVWLFLNEIPPYSVLIGGFIIILAIIINSFDKNKLKVIAINLDRGPKKKAIAFFEDNNIKNISLFFDSKNNIPREVKALGLPATILIDQNGTQIAKYLGPAEWDDQYFIDLLSKYAF